MPEANANLATTSEPVSPASPTDTVEAMATRRQEHAREPSIPAEASSAHPHEAASPGPPPGSRKIGAVDIGANSIHLVMAEVSTTGDFRIIGRDKEMVELGKGGFKMHQLTPRAMREGLDTLKRFAKMARRKGIDRLRVFATSAVREASNGGEFVARAAEQIHLNVRVISPEQEARLVYLAVRHTVALPEDPCLIADIGGGSLEMIVADRTGAQLLGSVKLGALRLAELFMLSNPPRMAEIKAMRRHIQVELEPWLTRIAAHGPQTLIGTSGTIGCLFNLVGGPHVNLERDPLTPAVVQRSQIKALINRLKALPADERGKLHGMESRRVDAMLPGAIVLHTLLKELRLSTVQYAEVGMREGMILDHISRKKASLQAQADWPDPRERSVIHLAQRCAYYRGHAEQVARLSLRLFDQLAELHHLDPSYRELLRDAALLHDVGYHIGHHDHHKHSYYLIRHGELRGFDPQEIEIIANIARYHRKERPKRDHFSFQNLGKNRRKPVRKLSTILRLANAFDRTHDNVVDDLTCSVYNDRVEIEVCTGRDAELELWTAARLGRTFEKEFKRTLVLRLARWMGSGGKPT